MLSQKHRYLGKEISQAEAELHVHEYKGISQSIKNFLEFKAEKS